MRPLRRIFSISDADLQTIAILYCTERLRRDLIDGLLTIDLHELSSVAVIAHQWKRLPLIGLQPFSNNFFVVVRPNDKSPAVDIADAFNFGWLKIDVVNPSTGGTRTTPANPLQ
jgi:hypothetical protein